MPQYKCAYLISCCWIGSSRAGECNHGKAIAQNQLARRLKPFGISPTTMRVNGWLARRMSAEARLRQRCGARLKCAPGNFCARSRAGQDPFPHRILRHGPWIRLNRSPLGRAAELPSMHGILRRGRVDWRPPSWGLACRWLSSPPSLSPPSSDCGSSSGFGTEDQRARPGCAAGWIAAALVVAPRLSPYSVVATRNYGPSRSE